MPVFLFPHTLFNSLPPLISTILDKDFYEPKTLESHSELYKVSRDNWNYPKYRFFMHVSMGVIMSLIVFYASFWLYNDTRVSFVKIR